MAANKEKTKEQKIRKKTRELQKIFANIDENKQKIVMPLIDRAAFIIVSLCDLEQEISANGWTEEYQNGANQSGHKKSAAADAHISLTKNLTAITKQLLELVPPAEEKNAITAFTERFNAVG